MRTTRVVFLAAALSCGAAWGQAAHNLPSTSPWVTAKAGVAAGKVEEFQLDNETYGKPRRIWVYTPAGYDAKRGAPYDLLVAFDGEEYVGEDIPLPTILNNLIEAGKSTAMVAVLIDNASGPARLADLANSARFADFLGNEVVPWVRKNYNVTHEAQRTIVTGSSAGGLGSAYVAYKRPDLFGNVLAQSGAFWRGNEASNDAPYEWLTAQYKASARLPVKFYLEVGAMETHRAVGIGPVFIEANRRLRDVLKQKGYTVSYAEVPGAQHEPGHWRNHLADGLLWLTQDWMTGSPAK